MEMEHLLSNVYFKISTDELSNLVSQLRSQHIFEASLILFNKELIGLLTEEELLKLAGIVSGVENVTTWVLTKYDGLSEEVIDVFVNGLNRYLDSYDYYGDLIESDYNVAPILCKAKKLSQDNVNHLVSLVKEYDDKGIFDILNNCNKLSQRNINDLVYCVDEKQWRLAKKLLTGNAFKILSHENIIYLQNIGTEGSRKYPGLRITKYSSTHTHIKLN